MFAQLEHALKAIGELVETVRDLTRAIDDHRREIASATNETRKANANVH